MIKMWISYYVLGGWKHIGLSGAGQMSENYSVHYLRVPPIVTMSTDSRIECRPMIGRLVVYSKLSAV